MFYEDKEFSSLILQHKTPKEKGSLFVNDDRKMHKNKIRLKENLLDCAEKIMNRRHSNQKLKLISEMKEYYANNDFRENEFYIDDHIKKCSQYFISAGVFQHEKEMNELRRNLRLNTKLLKKSMNERRIEFVNERAKKKKS